MLPAAGIKRRSFKKGLSPLDLNKHYNEVSFAMAHDSHTCGPDDNYGDDSKLKMNVDQTLWVADQLRQGIRAVRISTGTYRWQYGLNTPILEHGRPQQYGGGCAFGTLQDYLTAVYEFLVAPGNENEIVTIIDEGDAWGYAQEKSLIVPKDGLPVWSWNSVTNDDVWAFTQLVAAVYETVSLKGPEGQLLPDSAVKVKMYTPSGASWPTLQELITSKQRLVVFQNSLNSLNGVPWMLPAYDKAAAAITTSDSGNPLADPDVRPGFPGTFVAPERAWGGLYLLNHYFYHQIFSLVSPINIDINESARNLNKWVVGDLLVENTLRACARLKRRVNFLNVDFFQGVFGTYSYLNLLVDALNTVDDSLGAGSAAWLLALNDAVTKQVVYLHNTQHLCLGDAYYIRCAGNQGLSLTVNASGALVLDTLSAGNPAQQWRLLYNTPDQGITLVSKSGKQIILWTAPSQLVSSPGTQDYQALVSNGHAAGFDLAWSPDTQAFGIRVAGATQYGLAWGVDGKPTDAGSPVGLYGESTTGMARWYFTPAQQVPAAGVPGFVNRTHGQWQGNFEVVTPLAHGLGYQSYWRDNSVAAMAWHMGSANYEVYGSYSSVALIETPDGLACALATDSGYEYAVSNDGAPWQLQSQQMDNGKISNLLTTSTIPISSSGQGYSPSLPPALALSAQNTLDLLVPLNAGGFAHYRRAYESGTLGSHWTQVGGVVGPDKPIQSIALIQNTYDKADGVLGNLEVIARIGDHLEHFHALNDQWSDGTPIAVGGQPLRGLCGVPGFTQKTNGFFAVVVPLAGGGFAHYERSTSATNFTWSYIGSFWTNLNFDTISLIQSQKYGNLEIVARIGRDLVHFVTTDNKNWYGGTPFTPTL